MSQSTIQMPQLLYGVIEIKDTRVPYGIVTIHYQVVRKLAADGPKSLRPNNTTIDHNVSVKVNATFDA